LAASNSCIPPSTTRRTITHHPSVTSRGPTPETLPSRARASTIHLRDAPTIHTTRHRITRAPQL
jgi:hypothetical protein